MSYITHIGTATPSFKYTQSELAEYMIAVHDLEGEEAVRLRALYRASGIASRHSVLNDFRKQKNFTLFKQNGNGDIPSTEKRIKSYRKEALQLSVDAVRNALSDRTDYSQISHLVVVSCTGMYAPGLDIDLVRQLNLPSTVQRTNVTFMGCYAAFNALKLAHAVCKADMSSKVLIVCTELCSLHFQNHFSEDNVLSNALFADGSAAALVESNPGGDVSLKLESFFCDLLLNGDKDMAWSIGNFGFEMKLSNYVPAILQSGIKQLTSGLLSKGGLAEKDLAYFAIHPGGKKILDAIESELGLTKKQTEQSRRVLKNFGNMSSPTVLFVLSEILQSLNKEDHGKHILSFGFGPGLTMESALLQIHHH